MDKMVKKGYLKKIFFWEGRKNAACRKEEGRKNAVRTFVLICGRPPPLIPNGIPLNDVTIMVSVTFVYYS